MSSRPKVTTSMTDAMTPRPAKTVRVYMFTITLPSEIRETKPFTSRRWIRANRRRPAHLADDRVLGVGGRDDGGRGARHGLTREAELNTKSSTPARVTVRRSAK